MPPARRPRFYCVTDESLDATNDALRAACEFRGVDYVEVTAESFARLTLEPRPGDLLYRAAVDLISERIETSLWRDDLATFYADPLFVVGAQHQWLARHGVPVPRSVPFLTRDRAQIMRQVEMLGGLPVILKLLGGEGGHGVMRVDSPASLFSAADWLPSSALLMEYVEHKLAYRLIVIGRRVIETRVFEPAEDDFRTNAPNRRWLGIVRPPRAAVRIALRAAELLRVELGGVDVLVRPSGELVLTELNFPFGFTAPSREHATSDIAGAMIDYLLAKRR